MKKIIVGKPSGLFIAFLIALSIANPFRIFGQGSLTPPGSPGATMKSLDQIEPRTPISSLPFSISTPGSYYLTTNLTAITNGITITADDVTVDLNGFALVGSGGPYDGIKFTGSRLTVKNGTIRNWGGGAVWASGTSNNRFSNLLVMSNSIAGIYTGSRSLVESCLADATVTGLNIGGGSVVRDCAFSRNTTGVACGSDSSISNSIVITGCSFIQNTTGIGLSQNGVVMNNDFVKNSFAGVSANGGGNSIRNNHFSFNYNGYSSSSSSYTNLIINNTFTGSTNAAILGISSSLPIGPLISSSAVATNLNPSANYSF